MHYAYWAVTCKTIDCHATLFLKGGYIGPCEETATSIKVTQEPSESMEIPCAGCGKMHTYTRHDFVVVQWPHRVEPDAESEA